MQIILFGKVCLFDINTNETIIYGKYSERFVEIVMEYKYILEFCCNNPDFCIRIPGKIYKIDSIKFFLKNGERVEINEIVLCFPFENCDLSLCNKTSAIITTMCKHYSHRLDEWIKYNLRLGFSGIVIFNNDSNTSNTINEPTENCINNKSTVNICKKYPGKVWCVDFPYSPINNEHWNTIQRISLNIGVNAFLEKSRNIALIDADEFIYISKNPSIKIEHFLQDYERTITIKSNILTNKNNDDHLDNNILNLAKYIGEDNYTKTILKTDNIKKLEFILTPHEHNSESILDKNEIIYYHCWMNTRYFYNESMKKINIFGSVKTNHNDGFFSCCSVRLSTIINYVNSNKILPFDIDSADSFNLYKYDSKIDVTFDFFTNYNDIDVRVNNIETIDINNMAFQFDDYKRVIYKSINPFIKKYFSPSEKIFSVYHNLLNKYNINTENCIGLYYRGTDKWIETQLDSFDSYYDKLNEIIDTNNEKNIQIIIQTDSAQFSEYMKDRCTNKNIIIINENHTSYTNLGIHNERNSFENYVDIQYLFAIFLIISNCKYIICSSGNCSIWMMFYRNNANNVYQNLNRQWV